MRNSKVFSLLLLLLLMTGLILCNLEWYPGLDYIKSQLATWYAFEQRYPWQTAFIYLAVYIVLAALSLPGAGVMSLAAGGWQPVRSGGGGGPGVVGLDARRDRGVFVGPSFSA